MKYTYHKNARTTAQIRNEIRQSDDSITDLAKKYNLTRNTIYKWKKRDSVEDKISRPKRLQTKLTELEEYAIVEVRKSTLFPLDDLLLVMKEFIPHLSRQALFRCLKRHGVSNLKDLLPKEEKKPHKQFKTYEPGYLHIDIKKLPKLEDHKCYLFVAIDRATRFCLMAIKQDKSSKSAREFLESVTAFFPYKIHKILTDNGKEFTDVHFKGREVTAGKHLFEEGCQKYSIEHRLTLPYHPQTNGMVERMNGRVEQILETMHFNNYDELWSHLEEYSKCYNLHIRQRALDFQSPFEKIQAWFKDKPEIFVKNSVYNLSIPDI